MPRAPCYKRKILEWIATYEAKNFSSQTIGQYDRIIRRIWKYGIKNGWPMNPKRLQPKQVIAFLDHIKGLSTGTQSMYGITLLQFLRWCGNKQFEEFKFNIKVERSRVDWLTVEEATDIIAKAPDVWTMAMETMFIYTGIRLSELSTLRMNNVNEDFILVIGKGRKARKIPVSPELWEEMRPYTEWRRTRSGDLFLMHPKVCSHMEGPYSTTGIAQAIRRHSESYGRHFSPHTFRRSYGRHLYKAGMSLVEIQRLYGHASMEMTVRYLGITEEDLSSSVLKYQPSYKIQRPALSQQSHDPKNNEALSGGW